MRALANGVHLFTPADYRRMPWKNGRGWTTEIAVHPRDAGLNRIPFDWRVSVADVETDCEFSAFPGYDRTILLADGAGMELRFDSAPTQRIERCHEPFSFRGEWHTRCRLLNGSVRDLNVMTKRSGWRHSCAITRGIPFTLADTPGLHIVLAYCFQGKAELRGLKGTRDIPAQFESHEAVMYSCADARYELQIISASTDTVVAVINITHT